MSLSRVRRDTIERLRALRLEVNRFGAQIDALIADLEDGRRSTHPYDAEPVDAELLAGRLGVDLDPEPEGEIPDWVRERMAAIIGERL
jgi:hypothetical protein